MHNSTKKYVKRKISQLMEQCDITIDDIILAIDELEDDLGHEHITVIAKQASINAIKESFDSGVSITCVIADHVCKIYLDNRIEKIRKLENAYTIPDKRTYHL